MNEIESLELKISKFLRWGVILSGTLMFIGWIMQFKLKGNPFYFFFMYEPLSLTDLLKVYVSNGNWGVLITYAGLVVLISLPVIRVLLTIVLFIKQKEHTLAFISLLVLAGLITSMFLGIDL